MELAKIAGRKADNREAPAPLEFHIATLNRQIRILMEKTLKPHGLTIVEWRLLQCVQADTPKTICDLSVLAVIERTVTGRLIDRLVSRRLVAKNPLGTDRRVSQITLEPAGDAVLQACADDVAHARHALFQGITDADIAGMIAMFERMQDNVLGACHQDDPCPATPRARRVSS